MTDYLCNLNVSLRPEQSATRLLHQTRSVLFPEQEPEPLRRLFNEAMENAVRHYAANVAASSVTMEPRQIEEVSLRVVCATLYVYNLWRVQSIVEKNQPLTVSSGDLKHVHADDECLFYCRETFKKDYAVYAAALTGKSAADFARYEAGRERFWNR